MNWPPGRWITWLLCAALIVLGADASWAAVVYVPEITGTSGESVDIPIMIDRVDNLAGVKLVMEYDPKILSFQKGARTRHTDCFMHVINDRKPGRLIIVMAGAKGITGKAFPILTLTFSVQKGLTKNMTTQPALSEMELMTDQLKNITCDIKIHPLKISPHRKQPLIHEEVLQGE